MGNPSGQKVEGIDSPLATEDGSRAARGTRVTTAAPLRGGAVLRWQTAGDRVLLLASRGGRVRAPATGERLDGLSELSERVPAETPLGYRGCDEVYHYFCVPAGQTYCLPLHAWPVTAMPVTLGLCIPLVFAGDRLVVPSPEWSTELDLLSLQWILDA